VNKVVNNESDNKIKQYYKSKCLCPWENNGGKSNSHKTNIIKHSELLIMDKTIWYKGIFESFSLCSK